MRLVWTSFCQPLAFTFFLAYPGQTKCEILPSAELSKGPWGWLEMDVASVCPWNCLKHVLAKLQYCDAKELMPPLCHLLKEKIGVIWVCAHISLGTEPLWHSIRGCGWGII